MRVQTAGDRHQPRHRTAPRHRRRCRTAPASAARRARRRPAPARAPVVPPVTMSASSAQPPADLRVATWTAEPSRRRPGRPPPVRAIVRSPEAGRAATRRPTTSRHPPSASDTRSAPASTGSGSPSSDSCNEPTVEHRGRACGPQRGLGRRRRPSPQIRAVAMRTAQRLAGLLAGRRPRPAARPAEPAGQPRRSRQHRLARALVEHDEPVDPPELSRARSGWHRIRSARPRASPGHRPGARNRRRRSG